MVLSAERASAVKVLRLAVKTGSAMHGKAAASAMQMYLNFRTSQYNTVTRVLSKTFSQNRPEITPSSSMSMSAAAGTLGRPGMVVMSPASATTKPAPA